MSSNDYCMKNDLPLDVKDQNELIRIVAEKVGIPENTLREQASDLKKSWVKNRLSYWQLCDIADEIKRNMK